jgi:hypothetical protein
MSNLPTNRAFRLCRRLPIPFFGSIVAIIVISLRLFVVLTPFLFLVALLVVIIMQQAFLQQIAFMLLVKENLECIQV